MLAQRSYHNKLFMIATVVESQPCSPKLVSPDELERVHAGREPG